MAKGSTLTSGPFGSISTVMNPHILKVLKVFRKNYKEIPLSVVFDTHFHTLVAVMLSARTRDEVTTQVCKSLFKIATSPKQILEIGNWKMKTILHPLGFYKTKAKNLLNLSQMLLDKFSGKVPQTLEELTTLPGVGRKTANIILARCFNIPAIGVDTHVHRIANTLGWVNTKTPEKTEIELMKILPKKYWVEINHLFVSIGQQYRTKKSLEEFLKREGLVLLQ